MNIYDQTDLSYKESPRERSNGQVVQAVTLPILTFFQNHFN